ncbi:MAG: anti-CBASS protein Acb1 family protein, partial [Waterburya sp.]
KEQQIKSIDYLVVRHRHEVALNPSSNTVGCLLQTGEFLDFHFSRVLRFEGIISDRDLSFFNHSVIESAYSSYMDYHESLRSSKDMVASHSLFKLGIKGLNTYLKTDKDKRNQQGLRDRFNTMLEALQRVGAILFDTSEESAEFANRSYAGIEPLLKHLQEWVVAVSDMPRGKILGSAASGGLSEASEGERRAWNELIARHQNLDLKHNHLLIGRYIMLALGVKKPSLNVTYPPHYPLSPSEVATLRKTEAETDQIYLDRGVLLKNEIRESRFGGTERSSDIQVVGNVPEESTKEKELPGGNSQENK